MSNWQAHKQGIAGLRAFGDPDKKKPAGWGAPAGF